MESAKVRSERFLLKWRDMEPARGSYRWSERDYFIGALAAHGIRPVPSFGDLPRGSTHRSPSPPPAQSPTGRPGRPSCARRWRATGPVSSYWRTDFRQQFPRRRGASDHLLADLERAQPEERLLLARGERPGVRSEVRHSPADVPHRNQGRRSERQRRAGRDAQQRGLPRLDLPRLHLPRPRDQELLRGGRPAPLLVQRRRRPGRHAAVPCGDDTQRGRPHPAMGDRVRVGIGASGPVLQEQGPHRAARPAHQRVPDVPCQPSGVEPPTRLLVPVARPGRGLPRGQAVQHLRDRGPAALQPGRQARLAAFRSFTAETAPPVATITAGPLAGSFTNDSTPTFRFTSSEPGSSFQCRFDAGAFLPCASPQARTTPLANGPHTFYVRRSTPPGTKRGEVAPLHGRHGAASDHGHLGPPERLYDRRPHPHFRLRLQPGGLHLPMPLRCPALRRLFRAGQRPRPPAGLTTGAHSFEVRATDRANNLGPTPAKRTFTVNP